MANLSWQDLRIDEQKGLPRREFIRLLIGAAGLSSIYFNEPKPANAFPEAQSATVAKAPGGAETTAAIPWRTSAMEKGMRFTQDGKTGYEVTGDVYSQFENYGGQAAWGVPVSREWVDINNRKNQAFERGIFQVTTNNGRASTEWMNVYDELGKLGYDSWLADFKSTPKAINLPGDDHLNFAPSHHAGGPDAGTKEALRTDFVFENIPQYPQLKEYYFRNPLWFEQYGLPSAAADLGKVVVVRGQRGSFQLWKDKTDWTDQPMQIVPTTAGTIAREASEYGKTLGLQPLIPLDVLLPISMDAPVTPETGSLKLIEFDNKFNPGIQANLNPALEEKYRLILANAAKDHKYKSIRLEIISSRDQRPEKLNFDYGMSSQRVSGGWVDVGWISTLRQGEQISLYWLPAEGFDPHDPKSVQAANFVVSQYFTSTALSGGDPDVKSFKDHQDAYDLISQFPLNISASS